MALISFYPACIISEQVDSNLTSLSFLKRYYFEVNFTSRYKNNLKTDFLF